MVRSSCIISALCLFCFSCTPTLSTERETNISNKLNLQGYYYAEITRETDWGTKSIFYRVYVLYSNGVINYNTVEVSNIERIPPLILEYQVKYPNIPSSWGVYKIKNNDIMVDKWYPGGFAPSIIMKGSILNDTTFMLQLDKHTIDTYHFKYMSPKPDSTNQFIK